MCWWVRDNPAPWAQARAQVAALATRGTGCIYMNIYLNKYCLRLIDISKQGTLNFYLLSLYHSIVSGVGLLVGFPSPVLVNFDPD